MSAAGTRFPGLPAAGIYLLGTELKCKVGGQGGPARKGIDMPDSFA